MPFSQIFFWGVPIIALLSYLLLIVVFIAVKKDAVIRAFMHLLFVLTIWTGGSLLMKLQVYPSPLFWNKVMLVGLFLVPYAIYRFVLVFTNTKGGLAKYIWIFLTLFTQVLNIAGLVVVHAEVVTSTTNIAGSSARIVEFEYSLGWGGVPVYAILFIFLIYILIKTRKLVRLGYVTMDRMAPLMVGMFIIFFGAFANVYPPWGKYPIDLLAGFLNAILIVVAIYKRRLLELRFVFTKGLAFSSLAAVITVFYVYLVFYLEKEVGGRMAGIVPYFNTIFALLIALSFQPLYTLIQRLVDKLFYKTEYSRRMALANFSVSISDMLDLDEISTKLLDAIREAIHVGRIYFLVSDEENSQFHVYRTTARLAQADLKISPDNPIVSWFEVENRCITMEEILSHPHFKAMWEREKRALRDVGAEVIVPLRCRGNIIGMLVLNGKENNTAYTKDDLDLLASLGASSAVAIENARLYLRAQNEAITDSLTGIYNHRFFTRRLEASVKEAGTSCVSLLICDLDMFKLYNDLYGHYEGDVALQRVAGIMKGVVGNKGSVCRYGGEEFAIVLPCCDDKRAYDIAERIRTEVQTAFFSPNDTTKRFLTISIGLCTYPNSAGNSTHLLQYADIALYSAKNNGKNQTVIYNAQERAVDACDPLVRQTGEMGGSPVSATTVYALTAAIDAKDHYTFGHSQNVAEYARKLAQAIGMDRGHVELIREAGLLHDIGKIGIPEYILTKSGRLSPDEYDIMKGHVEMSITIIKHLPSLNYVIPAVIAHHERWDGSGYPRGIKAEEIPISARCLAIADAFDAMVSHRYYKPPYSVEYALKELEEKGGTQFDPNLVGVFAELVNSGQINISPSGTGIIGGPVVSEGRVADVPS